MVENLETRAMKAVFKIESKVADIDNVLRDLSMKLCHIIRRKGDYYSLPVGIDYDEGFGDYK
jgi:2-methylisocitrate lyase-like PEP mutase family enzyme